MLFAARMEPGILWLLIGTVGATTLVLFRVAARRNRGLATDRATAVSPPMETSCTPRGVERWEAELYEFTREAESRLNNKIAALQQLIATADERIAKLESLGLDTEQQTATASASSLSGPHFRATQPVRSEHAVVFAMHDAGHGAATIANRLQMAIGEVELILSLRSAPQR